MNANSAAMQLMVRLRDEAHELANRIHRTLRDTTYFYEMARLLPDLTENERKVLLQKFGSIRKIKSAAQNDFVKTLGEEAGKKVFVAVNAANPAKVLPLDSLIVPIRYDAPNGEAEDLQPLRLRNPKNNNLNA